MRKLLLTLLFAGGLQTLRAQEPASGNYRFPVRNVAGYYSANFGEMRPGHFHSGVDMETISRAMGHSSTRITHIYIKSIEEDQMINRANATVIRRIWK